MIRDVEDCQPRFLIEKDQNVAFDRIAHRSVLNEFLKSIKVAAPFTNLVPSEDLAEGAPTFNSKWQRALEAHLRERGIDPSE